MLSCPAMTPDAPPGRPAPPPPRAPAFDDLAELVDVLLPAARLARDLHAAERVSGVGSPEAAHALRARGLAVAEADGGDLFVARDPETAAHCAALDARGRAGGLQVRDRTRISRKDAKTQRSGPVEACSAFHARRVNDHELAEDCTEDDARAALAALLGQPRCCLDADLDDPARATHPLRRITHPWRLAAEARPETHPLLRPAGFTPCRLDCAAATAAGAAALAAIGHLGGEDLDPADVVVPSRRSRPPLAALAATPALVLSHRAWLTFGETPRGRLHPDDAGALAPLLARWPASAADVAVDGRRVTIGAAAPDSSMIDLSAVTLGPLVFDPRGAPLPRPVRVAALDLARDAMDFGGDYASPRELQFAAGDLLARGHEAHLVRATTGVLGLAWSDALEDRLVAHLVARGVEVALLKLHVSDRLPRLLAAAGVAPWFLAAPLVRPPEGAYALTLEADRRLDAVDAVEALARGDSPGACVDAAPAREPFVPLALFHPVTAAVDLAQLAAAPDGAEPTPTPYARFQLLTNRGCPWSAPVADNPVFAGLALPPGAADRGCSFCEMGGDYAPLAVADPLGHLVAQAAWYAAHAPGAELIVTDEAAFDYLGRLLERLRDAGLAELTVLVKARVQGLLRRFDRFARGLERVHGTRLQVICFLIGVENFSDAELLRYNKGVSAEEILACLARLDALADAFPGQFTLRRYMSHGFILFNPWTTVADLAANAAVFNRPEIRALIAKAPFSRLRLYAWQPLAALAARDGLLLDDAAPTALRTHLGYASDELPWRFADPRVALCYALVSHAIEALDPGADARFEVLSAALDYVAACPDAALADHDHEGRFLAALRRRPRAEWPGSFALCEALDVLAGRDAPPGWRLEALSPSDDGVAASLRDGHGRALVVDLAPRDPSRRALFAAGPFQISYRRPAAPLGAADARWLEALARLVARAAARSEQGTTAGPSGRPAT